MIEPLKKQSDNTISSKSVSLPSHRNNHQSLEYMTAPTPDLDKSVQYIVESSLHRPRFSLLPSRRYQFRQRQSALLDRPVDLRTVVVFGC